MGSQALRIAPKSWQVRVGRQELGRIFHLRDSLDQSEELIQHVDRYQKLGWLLEARGEGTSTLDFSQPSESWAERLMTLALSGVAVDLGVKTGQASKLLVIETRRGEVAVDRYGEWGSPCRAQTKDGWEQHYYALAAESRTPFSGEDVDFQVRVYGQSGLVLVPPSRRGGSAVVWTWLNPPWKIPPAPPRQPVWRFLEDCGLLPGAGEAEANAPPMLPWEQVYRLIAPQEEVIRTLLTPAPSVETYYQDLARAALQAGIREPEVISALLWHAPQGDARTSPERLPYLRELVATMCQENGRDQGLLKQGSISLTAVATGPPSQSGPAADSQPSMDDLVGFMENRVILDRSRYENMIYELAELSAKAEALERRVEDYARRFEEGQSPPVAEPALSPALSSISNGFVSDYAATAPPSSRGRQLPLSELKTVVQEFLKKNGDLASHPSSVQMLQFCLKNYIDLNPELNGLPLGEKLEMAGNLARKFMDRVGQGL